MNQYQRNLKNNFNVNMLDNRAMKVFSIRFGITGISDKKARVPGFALQR